jgi:hypothetical protein
MDCHDLDSAFVSGIGLPAGFQEMALELGRIIEVSMSGELRKRGEKLVRPVAVFGANEAGGAAE